MTAPKGAWEQKVKPSQQYREGITQGLGPVVWTDPRRIRALCDVMECVADTQRLGLSEIPRERGWPRLGNASNAGIRSGPSLPNSSKTGAEE